MAVTINSRSIIMTADGDAYAGKIKVTSISLVGTGMTPGERVTIHESPSLAVIADHYIEAANENVELLNNPQWFDGLLLNCAPDALAGTWNLIIRYE